MEYIHSKNYIHRDIKPENFLVGYGSRCSEIYAIDFGLAKLYRIPPKGVHIPYKVGRSLTGTALYASIFTHLGCEQSRRDDLEGIVYMSLYLMKGSLPWQGLEITKKLEMSKKMLELKQSISIEELCAGLPGEIGVILKYVRGLKFDENPDYKKIINLLNKAATNAGFELNKEYDWVKLKESMRKERMKQEALIEEKKKEGSLSRSKELEERKTKVEENTGREEVKVTRSPDGQKQERTKSTDVKIESQPMLQTMIVSKSKEFESPE